jgi:prephenate dehydrogenase
VPHVGILGTGLIGASIGHGLRAAGWDVTGWDPDPGVAARALQLGAVVALASDEAELAASSLDLLVLAGPPGAIIATVAAIDPPALTMDVAGVKQPVVAAARPRRFVGTHPMAGRELTGPEAASPALFRGAAWVVVTDDAAAADLAAVDDVIRTLGARPVHMTAREHDDAVAMISHLSQVVAATLLTEASDRTRALDLAAGSFRDLTRVAASDPEIWASLLAANQPAVVAAVEDMRRRLAQVVDLLQAGDTAGLRRMLEDARRLRRSLAPPMVAVQVALADEPGEIAKVGHALEASGVDVRDLQLRHAPHGGGGVLTLSVRPGDGEPLRQALVSEGLIVVD